MAAIANFLARHTPFRFVRTSRLKTASSMLGLDRPHRRLTLRLVDVGDEHRCILPGDGQRRRPTDTTPPPVTMATLSRISHPLARELEDAGVAEEEVDSPEAISCRLHHGFHLGSVTDVSDGRLRHFLLAVHEAHLLMGESRVAFARPHWDESREPASARFGILTVLL